MLSGQNDDFDYAFIGLGASGGLMLEALNRCGLLDQKRVIIFEPNAKTVNDKTYCFWAEPSDPLVITNAADISHSWSEIKIDAQDKQRLAPLRYYHLRSIDFYRRVALLATEIGSMFVRESVHEVTPYHDGFLLESATVTVTAKWVFDSRLPGLAKMPSDYDLYQSFVGFRVKLKSPAFDREVYEMMDFRVPQDGETQFCYTLPFSTDHALVELTRFGVRRVEAGRAREVLHAFIVEKYGDYEVIDEEIGVIPMTTAVAKHALGKRYIALGTRAGKVKPSTGYAFKNMFTHADAVAKHVAQDHAMVSKPMNRFGWYDRLLLRILRDAPHRGAEIFRTLFQRCDAVDVLRFLDEKTTPIEEAKMFSRLPILLFLKAAMGDTMLRLKPLLPALMLCFFALSLSIGLQLYPEVTSVVGYVAVVIGMLLVGIPHGALDEVVELRNKRSKNRWSFYAWYLGIIGLVFTTWQYAPWLGLVVFLIYSAYHFGQTDLQDWGIKSSLPAFLWGSFVLWSLLFYHVDETIKIVELMGVSSVYRPDAEQLKTVTYLLWGGAVLFAVKRRSMKWLLSILLLSIGTALPLLFAFGLYFIGQHSISGWSHLKRELSLSHAQMQRLALPYSLGAWIIFAAMMLHAFTAAEKAAWESIFFVFIACLSLPHIAVMHRLYEKRTARH